MIFDLAGLLRALSAAQVRFVVIGGIAVAAHRIVRATEDVDLVPDPDRENLDRLCNVLASLDARLARDPSRSIDAQLRQELRRGRNLSVTTALGDLDVVQRIPGVPSYATLEADAWDAELFDVVFRVCSFEHLVAMKRERGWAHDVEDLTRLLMLDEG